MHTIIWITGLDFYVKIEDDTSCLVSSKKNKKKKKEIKKSKALEIFS